MKVHNMKFYKISKFNFIEKKFKTQGVKGLPETKSWSKETNLIPAAWVAQVG